MNAGALGRRSEFKKPPRRIVGMIEFDNTDFHLLGFVAGKIDRSK